MIDNIYLSVRYEKIYVSRAFSGIAFKWDERLRGL